MQHNASTLHSLTVLTFHLLDTFLVLEYEKQSTSFVVLFIKKNIFYGITRLLWLEGSIMMQGVLYQRVKCTNN